MKALPCPFCGCEQIIVGTYIRDGARTECYKCHASVIAFNPDSGRKSLDLWNTRSEANLEPKR